MVRTVGDALIESGRQGTGFDLRLLKISHEESEASRIAIQKAIADLNPKNESYHQSVRTGISLDLTYHGYFPDGRQLVDVTSGVGTFVTGEPRFDVSEVFEYDGRKIGLVLSNSNTKQD